MTHQTPGRGVVLSTDRPIVKRVRCFVRSLALVFLVAPLALGVVIYSVQSWFEQEYWVVSACYGVMVLFSVSVLKLYGRATHLGTWIINDKGVEYRPPQGRPVFLAWDNVEKVQVTPIKLSLAGSGLVLRIPWRLFSAPRSRRALRALQQYLGSGFDFGVLDHRRGSQEDSQRDKRCGRFALRVMLLAWVLCGLIALLTFVHGEYLFPNTVFDECSPIWVSVVTHGALAFLLWRSGHLGGRWVTRTSGIRE